MTTLNSAGSQATVVIAGGGPSGTLTALHLVRAAAQHRVAVRIVVVDPTPRLGSGTAFGTQDRAHRLNVPASGMSAFPQVPGDFVDWLGRTRRHSRDPHEFATRGDFAEYLRRSLEKALCLGARYARLSHRRSQAVRLEPHGAGIRVELADGGAMHADALVVATGLPDQRMSWVPSDLASHSGFIADPWKPGALDEVVDGGSALGEVLLVGTGLTMVDVALTLAHSRPAWVLHTISRSGRLPEQHVARCRPPAIPDISDWTPELSTLREKITRYVHEVEMTAGDWRPAVDGLRFHLASLWCRLSEDDQKTFLREDASRWNRVRHRIAPTSAQAIAALRRSGRLCVSAARVKDVSPLVSGVRVELNDGTSRDVDWVINCTGPETDIRAQQNPLLADLLRQRDGCALATISTAGLGLCTKEGRLIDTAGHTGSPIWTLGALRRGDLWESTAIPEIRSQASSLALDVLDEIVQVRVGRQRSGPDASTIRRQGSLRRAVPA